ncbi:MAG: outer membrane protein assembly factor BamA [Mariprofundaceae bacterium]|nr:outer membrane protein assembly factor BamA [Mariprofundaceae bacterium]
MRLIQYGLVLLCAFFSLNVWAASGEAINTGDRIISLNVEGNRYIESAAILMDVDTKVGDRLNQRTMSRDIQRLYVSGVYQDLKFTGVRNNTGIKLTLHVKEQPFISHYEIIGNDAVTSKDLKHRLKLKDGMIFTPSLMRKDINTLRRGYLKKGFYQVNIQPEKTMLSDGSMKLMVHIIEGDKTRVRQIRFMGNHDFTDDALISEVSARSSNLLTWLINKDIINQKKFKNDAQHLSQFYQDHGYLDMKVESSQLLLTPDKKSFYLNFSIHEGAIYTINKLDVTGDLIPSKEKLMDKIKLAVGQHYSLSDLRTSIQNMTILVGDEGYAFANVTPLFKRNLTDHTVAITFDVEKGRKVYIERIEIEGNEKTDDIVARREMRLDESERFSATGMRLSKEKLGRLQLFKDVRISMPKGSAPDRVNVKVNVTENKTGSFIVGFGYSQIQKMLFRVKTSQKNLLGKGYGLSATADVGSRTQNFNVSLSDPYFLDRDIQASVNVNKTQTKLTQIQRTTYTQNNVGGGFGLTFALSEHVSNSINYQYSNTNISNLPVNSTLILQSQAGHQTTSELGDTLYFDSRDRATETHSGAVYSLHVSGATVGGNNRFVEESISTKKYFSMSNDVVLRASSAVSLIQGYARKNVPIYRRYSLGGGNILHGFDYYGVSMRDPITGAVVGGNKKLSANLDLFFPLPYVQTSGIRGVLFVDVGTVWGSAISNVPAVTFNANSLRASTGLGIEWASPVGPVTLSFAKVLKKQPQDILRSFNFGLGTTF